MKRLTFIAVLVVLLVFATASTSFGTFGIDISQGILDVDRIEKEGDRENLDDPGEYGSAHKHMYFETSIANKTVDFSQDKYQLQSKLVHFENGNGEILHVHAKNIDLDMFLSTLDIELNRTCVDIGQKFCSNETHEMRVYVNSEIVAKPGTYVMEQGDHIMLWYGREEESPGMDFFERELPKEYRPTDPGRQL